MRMARLAPAIVLLSALITNLAPAAEIRWDSHGIPHIYGSTIEDTLRGFGYAQMQNHAEQILLNVAAARGRYSEFFGAGLHEVNVENDTFVHTVGIPEWSRQWLSEGGAVQRGYIEAFVDGANLYAQRHGNTLSPRIRRVLPLVPTDVMALSLRALQFEICTWDTRGLIEDWVSGKASAKLPIYGSNAWAIAPQRTTTGNAVLIANPHLSWEANGPSQQQPDQLPQPSAAILQFMQAHLVVGDPARPLVNLSGGTFLGSPFISFGFNDYLGWTHTVNNIRASEVFELTLEGARYRYGRGTKNLQKRQVTLKICDSADACTKRTLNVENSIHGPLLARRGNKALALRVSGLEASGLVAQYWDMAQHEGNGGCTQAPACCCHTRSALCHSLAANESPKLALALRWISCKRIFIILYDRSPDARLRLTHGHRRASPQAEVFSRFSDSHGVSHA